jgi:hypothetical protein
MSWQTSLQIRVLKSFYPRANIVAKALFWQSYERMALIKKALKQH